jgi:hypothetical protein
MFPITNTPYHFFYLSNLYGYRYDARVGGIEVDGLYLVDPLIFEAKLHLLLESGCPLPATASLAGNSIQG